MATALHHQYFQTLLIKIRSFRLYSGRFVDSLSPRNLALCQEMHGFILICLNRASRCLFSSRSSSHAVMGSLDRELPIGSAALGIGSVAMAFCCFFALFLADRFDRSKSTTTGSFLNSASDRLEPSGASKSIGISLSKTARRIDVLPGSLSLVGNEKEL